MAMQIIQREDHCKKTSRAPRKTKISLEDYLHLLESRNYSDLSINFLNQIISMHGYKKLHSVPKKVMAEAASGISLINPRRSTINDEISPAVSPTFEVVVSDLDQLNWQECSMTSVQTLNSSIHMAISSSSATPDPKTHFSNCSEHKTKQKALVTKEDGGSSASSGEKLKVWPSKRVMKRKKQDFD